MKKPSDKRILIIGLDSATPELVFNRWKEDLPNLSWLAGNGFFGEMASSIPAITIPAWTSMFSSRDPGVLGIYGFRNRADYSYDRQIIATSAMVKHPRVWDYISKAKKGSIVIGVPQTYPVMPVNGFMISDFLTPGLDNNFTYPDSLKGEILKVVPDYEFDVKQYRTEDKDWLLDQIYQVTEKHFKVVDYLMVKKSWDLFTFVEIGLDRIHHGFWNYFDQNHKNYIINNPYERVVHDYYVFLDKKIGELLDRISTDTVVMVVSDHGAKRLDGGICINEWLWRNGYLTFKNDPEPGKIFRLEEVEVDWENTFAWGEGGYYGRIYINLKGREPQGTIEQGKYREMRDELASKLLELPDHQGNDIGTKLFYPEEVYQDVNGIAPDLMVYFGDLYWRSVGSVGYGSYYTFENDTGPDACNHAQNGLIIIYDPYNPGKGRQLIDVQLMDVTPTVLQNFDLEIPMYLQGKRL